MADPYGGGTMMDRSGARGGLQRGCASWKEHLGALVPGLIAVALMILWAEHDGGYDADTWYWGALLLLALGAGLTVARGLRRTALTRTGRIALGAFALYVAWSYLSIAWASAPGSALEGSNRALLYLIVFGLMATLPWTPRGALVALLAFALGIGVLAVTILLRLAAADHVEAMIVSGRLEATTGYFNATAALFTIGALTTTALAARRELPGLLRGLLIALAAASLQLVVIAQSRGWLFTLPIVLILVIVVVRDRMRFVAAAVLPVAAAVIPAHRLIAASQSAGAAALNHAVQSPARLSLMLCAAALVLGTLLAWSDRLITPPALSRRRRLGVAAVVTALVLAAASVGALKVTSGDPAGFVKAQWNGFRHDSNAADVGSHFTTVGSGRYDFWRVALKAFASHPIGGLGQDNFGDYYILHRRTDEEPTWTHSLEMRLLAQTGIVGFALFFVFLVAAVALARRARRIGDGLTQAVVGVALLPLIVWFVHGSVDWFWELPALTGPALGFLGIACSLSPQPTPGRVDVSSGVYARTPPGLNRRRRVAAGAATAVLIAAVVTLGFSYLSVREVSMGTDASATNTAAALADLSTAAKLNPLSSVPGRFAGAYALQAGDYQVAAQRFGQSREREPGAWFAWLGSGLAASALGDLQRAHTFYLRADQINSKQPAVTQALNRIYGKHPLSVAAAFRLLQVAQ
jgi:hypothetical protein